jgi:hypothetical protein
MEENMNADHEIIPIVEEDRGGGRMDPLHQEDLNDLEKKLKKQAKRETQMRHARRK